MAKKNSHPFIISNRRTIVSQIFLNSGGSISCEDLATQLFEEHGITASDSTISRDLAALRSMTDGLAGRTSAEWRQMLVAELTILKAEILARGSMHDDYVQDLQRTIHMIAKFVGAYSPTVINITGLTPAQMSSTQLLAKSLLGLTPDQQKRLLAFGVALKHESPENPVADPPEVQSILAQLAEMKKPQAEKPLLAVGSYGEPEETRTR